MDYADIVDDLVAGVEELEFSEPVTHVYNPLKYAREPCLSYLERYGEGPVEVLLFGINPGPWGMAQTGVPFGDVDMVRDWMGIEAPVGKPEEEHPKRIVEGFSCSRNEVSGSRLWGWAEETFGEAEAFFERFFVINYCPLMFLEKSGRNRTPDRLPVAERRPLLEPCDEALRRVVDIVRPAFVVGIGNFAAGRAEAALGDRGDLTLGKVLHPSPASPMANRGWAGQAEEQLEDLGIELPDGAVSPEE